MTTEEAGLEGTEGIEEREGGLLRKLGLSQVCMWGSSSRGRHQGRSGRDQERFLQRADDGTKVGVTLRHQCPRWSQDSVPHSSASVCAAGQ